MYHSPEDNFRMRFYRKMMRSCIKVDGCVPSAPTFQERGSMMGACCNSCAEGKTCDSESHKHDKQYRRVEKVSGSHVGNGAAYYSRVQAKSLFPHMGEEVYRGLMSDSFINNSVSEIGNRLVLLKRHILNNTTLRRDGEYLTVTHRDSSGNGDRIVVRLPFAPIMRFCQNMAMLYGSADSRPNTVMGYAPIIALITSQLAAKELNKEKSKDKDGKNPKGDFSKGKEGKEDAGSKGPLDLSSLIASLTGGKGGFNLSSIVGVEYIPAGQQASSFDVVKSCLGCGPVMGEEALPNRVSISELCDWLVIPLPLDAPNAGMIVTDDSGEERYSIAFSPVTFSGEAPWTRSGQVADIDDIYTDEEGRPLWFAAYMERLDSGSSVFIQDYCPEYEGMPDGPLQDIPGWQSEEESECDPQYEDCEAGSDQYGSDPYGGEEGLYGDMGAVRSQARRRGASIRSARTMAAPGKGSGRPGAKSKGKGKRKIKWRRMTVSERQAQKQRYARGGTSRSPQKPIKVSTKEGSKIKQQTGKQAGRGMAQQPSRGMTPTGRGMAQRGRGMAQRAFARPSMATRPSYARPAQRSAVRSVARTMAPRARMRGIEDDMNVSGTGCGCNGKCGKVGCC